MSFIRMPERSHQAPATIMIQPITFPFFMRPLLGMFAAGRKSGSAAVEETAGPA
jgi:hypothetical protein